MPGQTVSEF